MQLSDVIKLQEKTWTQKGNGVQAVINAVHKATQGQYNWKQPVNITDLTGNTMDITFETEYPDSLLNQSDVGKRAVWRLKWWSGRHGQNISGYVETQLNEAGQPEKWQLPQGSQTTPPSAPQNPQNRPQRPNVPQGKETPDWDAIAKGKVRHGIVCAGIQAGTLVCKSIPDIDFWAEYIVTGIEPMSPADEPGENLQECRKCGGNRNSCGCPPF